MKKMLLVGLLLGTLVSCGGQSNGSDVSVKGFLDSMKSGQFDKVEQYAEGYPGQTITQSLEQLPQEWPNTMTLMFAKLSYKIGKAQVEGDNATVSLNLTNTNMVEVREKLKVAALEATLSKRQMTTTEIFKKVLNDSSNKTTSTDTSVKLKKISGKWQIAKDGNEAFGVALLGGMGDLSTLRR